MNISHMAIYYKTWQSQSFLLFNIELINLLHFHKTNYFHLLPARLSIINFDYTYNYTQMNIRI